MNKITFKNSFEIPCKDRNALEYINSHHRIKLLHMLFFRLHIIPKSELIFINWRFIVWILNLCHYQKFRSFWFFWGLFFGINDSFNNVKKVSEKSFALLLTSGIDEFNNTTVPMNAHLKVINKLRTIKTILFARVYEVRRVLGKIKNFVFEKRIFGDQFKGTFI